MNNKDFPVEQARRLLFILKDQKHPLYDMVSSVVTVGQFTRLQKLAQEGAAL